jgi:hypothetical protein
MNIPELPGNIRLHPNVWRTIKEIAILDEEKAGRIAQRVIGLGLDPVPVSGDCKSGTIINLNNKGIRVKKLKCLDIFDSRSG